MIRISLILVLASMPALAMTPEDETPAGQYTHLLYGRMVKVPGGAANSELVLHRLRPIDDASEEDSVRSICNLTHFRKLVGVVGGHAIIGGAGGGNLECVSLATGEKSQSSIPAVAMVIDRPRGRVYFNALGSTFVQSFDVASGEESKLFQGRKDRPATMGGFGRGALAISSDGKQLAVATFANKDEQPEMFQEQFEIHLVNLDNNAAKPIRVPGTFTGHTFMTGGGDRLEAPSLYWFNATTLLVATTNPQSPGQPTIVGGRSIGQERAQVISIDIRLLKRKQVCEADGAVATALLGSSFAKRPNGSLTLTTVKGTFRLNLSDGSSEADTHLSKYFRLQGSGRTRMLLGENRRLGRSVLPRDVFVSPNGRESVWLEAKSTRGMHLSWIHAPKRMFHSDAGGKPAQIGEGQYEAAGLLWLRETDLKP